MRLIINGFDIEIEPDEKIARTLQVNDILSLNNRQTNYTNTFSVRKTDANKRAFDFLGVVGIISLLPYQLNEVYLYTDDGECIVHKGRAVVQSTDKDYKINIYDGNIDLYKAIENKSLGDLNLSEIDHSKLLSTVVNSFTANLPYKYIVADYNGKMIYNNNRINVDYLVPSAKASYLWNKIFDTYGFTYSGSIFNTVDFTNLWLTYPKFEVITEAPVQIFNQTTQLFTNNAPPGFNYIVPLTATYSIDINSLATVNPGVVFFYYFDEEGNTINSGTVSTLSLFINGVPVANQNTTPLNLNLNIGDVVDWGYEPPFELWQVEGAVGYSASFAGNFQFQLIVSQYQGVTISFTNELKDFSIKDFITEILNRFGLTPFKDKYTNNYRFLTLQELLQNNQIVDWSREKNKFVEKISERYVYGSYAQENNFTYKYNDNESDYYNSEILINNLNLADNKVVVNSRFFAPEKDRSILIHDLQTNVYKIWNKEIKDNGSIEYRGLQKRYYLMREALHTFTTNTQIGSESLGTHQSITTIPVESFYNLRMEDVIRNYYGNIGAVLNFSKIIDATIYLNETDIANMDFSKLYWIKQLSSYYILNKVNNFIKTGVTKVELIKVDYAPPLPIFQGLEGSGFNILIDEVKNVIPRLHFGFNQREITANVGEEITIYQDTIYNENEYDKPIITAPGATIIQSDINIIKVSFSTSGAKTLSASISNSSKSITVESNVLNITVI
jgi:hypothetical protein